MNEERIDEWMKALSCLRALLLQTFPKGLPTLGRMVEDVNRLQNGLRRVRWSRPEWVYDNAYLEAEKLLERKDAPPRAVRKAWTTAIEAVPTFEDAIEDLGAFIRSKPLVTGELALLEELAETLTYRYHKRLTSAAHGTVGVSVPPHHQHPSSSPASSSPPAAVSERAPPPEHDLSGPEGST